MNKSFLSSCTFCLVVFCTSIASGGDLVYWNRTGEIWENWKTPNAWTIWLGDTKELPTEGDIVRIGQLANETAWVKIDSILPSLTGLLIGTGDNSTTKVEIASGSYVPYGSSSLRVTSNEHNTEAVGGHAELLVSGGLITNTANVGIMIGGVNGGGRNCYGKMTIQDGLIYANGINMGTTDRGTGQLSVGAYEQSGGAVTNFHRMATANTNSSFKLSGGSLWVSDTLTSQGPFLMSGGHLSCKNMSFYSDSKMPYDGRGAVLSGGFLTNGCDVVDAAAGYCNNILYLYSGTLAISGSVRMVRRALTIAPEAGKSVIMQIDGGRVESYYNGYYGTDSLCVRGEGNAVYRQTGGYVSSQWNLDIKNANAPWIEISGGELSLGKRGKSSQSIGRLDINNNDATNLATFCVRGTPKVEFVLMPRSVASGYSNTNMPHFLFQSDHRGLNPIQLILSEAYIWFDEWNAINGHITVHPYGGFQVMTNASYALLKADKAMIDPGCYGRPDPGLWRTNFLDGATKMLWGVTLTNTAEIANNFASATGVPYGYFSVPYLKADRILGSYAELTLAPQGTNTLDGLVAGMVKGGYEVEVTDASAGKVKVNFAPDALGDRVTNRKLLFDFTMEAKPTDARDGIITTNALVKTFSFGVLKKGLMMLVR